MRSRLLAGAGIAQVPAFACTAAVCGPRDGRRAARGFLAGYGPSGDVPADMQQAVLMLAAHAYEIPP